MWWRADSNYFIILMFLLLMVTGQLEEQKIKRKMLSGNLSDEQRTEVIRGFKAGEFEVLLLSMGSSKEGITLVNSNRMIIMDQDLSPHLESQVMKLEAQL